MSDAHADHDLSKPDPRVEGWGGNDDAPELSAEQAAALQQREEPVAAADFGLPLTGDLGRGRGGLGEGRRPGDHRAGHEPGSPRGQAVRGLRRRGGRLRLTPAHGASRLGARPHPPGAGDHPGRVRWAGTGPGEGRCGPVRRRGRPDRQRRLGPPPEAPMRPACAASGPAPARGPTARRTPWRRWWPSWRPVVWRDAEAPAPRLSRRPARRRPRPPGRPSTSARTAIGLGGPGAGGAVGLRPVRSARRLGGLGPGAGDTAGTDADGHGAVALGAAEGRGAGAPERRGRGDRPAPLGAGAARGAQHRGGNRRCQGELSALSARLKAHIADLRTWQPRRSAASGELQAQAAKVRDIVSTALADVQQTVGRVNEPRPGRGALPRRWRPRRPARCSATSSRPAPPSG